MDPKASTTTLTLRDAPLRATRHHARHLGRTLVAIVCLAGWLLMGGSALASSYRSPTADRWHLYPQVGLLENVRLRVHWYENSDDFHKAAETNGLSPKGLFGFSILRRNTSTGEYVCDVHVIEMTGEHVDQEHTMTFGHEVLHCFGLKHE